MRKPPQIPDVDIVEACRHPKLLNIPLSAGQAMVLKATYGLAMDSQEEEIFCESSGLSRYVPGCERRELVLIAGRRSGKSAHIATPIASYEAAFRKHSHLRPGERASVVVGGPSKDQAAITYAMIRAVFSESLLLRSLIDVVGADKLSLRTGSDVCVWRADLRQVRGLAIATYIAEEASFWRDENDSTLNPCEEVFAAVRPALLTFPHGKLVMVSSPWAKSGPVWEAFRTRRTDASM